jgi:hypothetical protein
VTLLTVAELVTLPKGQAFSMLSGGQLWKIRIPQVEAITDDALPPVLRHVITDMERHYVTNDYWYRQRETWWLAAGGAAGAKAHGEAAGTA